MSGRAAHIERIADQRDAAVLQRHRPVEQSARRTPRSASCRSRCGAGGDRSSRGSQTKPNRWRPSGLRTSTSFGRGRSARLIAVSASSSRSAGSKAVARSCGSAVSAWVSALPVWPAGIEAELMLQRSQPRAQHRHVARRRRRARRRSTARHGSTGRRPSCRRVPARRPGRAAPRGARGEIRLDLSSNGSVPPFLNQSTASAREASARIGASCFQRGDAEPRFAPARRRPGLMAQQREIAVEEPLQQRRALRVRDAGDVVAPARPEACASRRRRRERGRGLRRGRRSGCAGSRASTRSIST